MKPRLESAPRTPEDRAIWLRLMHGKYPPLPIWSYLAADRRDADLMYTAQLCHASGIDWFDIRGPLTLSIDGSEETYVFGVPQR
jgi:hypothetical protein